MSKFTKRITAMLLSGMLAIGSATGSVYAAAADVDPGLTSEIAEEVFTEEPVETSEALVESAETSEIAEEVFPEEVSAENTEAPVDLPQVSEEAPQEEAVTSYTVTLDANGGYFENEWDDSIGDYVEQAEVVVKQIPVDGAVAAFPVYKTEADGQTMTFAGWSLERDGELVSQAEEEYTPVENCVLYAVWQAAETEDASLGETVGQVVVNEGDEQDDTVQGAEEAEDASEETVTAEEETQPELNDSFQEEETVREDAANDVMASGTCGANLTWTLDEEGTLIISGTGEMDTKVDYKKWSWYSVRLNIKTVIVEYGATTIGRTAFATCSNITNISIPNSVTTIDIAAFNLCSSLTDVYYYGSENNWNEIIFYYYNDPLSSATIHFVNGIDVSLEEEDQSQQYTGSEIRPVPVVKGIDGSILTEDTDYTLSYSNNIDPGTATITAAGLGKYSGQTASVTFEILPIIDAEDAESVLKGYAAELSAVVTSDTAIVPEQVDFFVECIDTGILTWGPATVESVDENHYRVKKNVRISEPGKYLFQAKYNNTLDKAQIEVLDFETKIELGPRFENGKIARKEQKHINSYCDVRYVITLKKEDNSQGASYKELIKECLDKVVFNKKQAENVFRVCSEKTETSDDGSWGERIIRVVPKDVISEEFVFEFKEENGDVLTKAVEASRGIVDSFSFRSDKNVGDEKFSYNNHHLFYFSDDFFYGEATNYNNSLAVMTLGMAMASYSDPDQDADNTYGVNLIPRWANISEAYQNLHFENNISLYKYEEALSNSDDSAAFSMNTKYIASEEGDDTLVAVVIRGGGYGGEWASNFNVDESDDSRGFREPAEIVFSNLKQYLTDLKSQGKIIGNVKLWITGFSRGGAVANLFSHSVNSAGNVSGVQILPENNYTYTFATPSGHYYVGDQNTDHNIFNVISENDLVPKIPLGKWDFSKYGENIILPTKTPSSVKQRFKALTGLEFTASNQKTIENFLMNVVYCIAPSREDYVNYLQKYIVGWEKAIFALYTTHKLGFFPGIGLGMVTAGIHDIHTLRSKGLLDLPEKVELIFGRGMRTVGAIFETVKETDFKKIHLSDFAFDAEKVHYPEHYLSWLETGGMGTEASETAFVYLTEAERSQITDHLAGFIGKYSEDTDFKVIEVDGAYNISVLEPNEVVLTSTADGISLTGNTVAGVASGEGADVFYSSEMNKALVVLEADHDYSVQLYTDEPSAVSFSISECDAENTSRTVVYSSATEGENDTITLNITGAEGISEYEVTDDNGSIVIPMYDSSISSGEYHSVNVSGGYAVPETASPGEVVRVYWNNTSDNQFISWKTLVGSFDFNDSSSRDTYFFMPAHDVFIKAETNADTPVACGKCGDQIYWELDQEGKLSIIGNGEIPSFVSHQESEGEEGIPGEAPWYPYTAQITKVELCTNITGIGDFAFEGCNGLKYVSIPPGTTALGKGVFRNCNNLSTLILHGEINSILEEAFSGCDCLSDIYFAGSEDDWSRTTIDSGNAQLSSAQIHYNMDISNSMILLENNSFVFDGKAKQPAAAIIGLEEGEDFTIGYENNINSGEGTIILSGIGDFKGVASASFTIKPRSIAKAEIIGISDKTYTGKAITHALTVKIGSTLLAINKDYTVSYTNNTNAGSATVKISGKGNYTDTAYKTFKINKASQSITVKAAASSAAVGKTTTVSITGAKGTKSYKSSNTAIATVTSAGKVTAKKVGTVKITATSAATANYKAAAKTVTIKVVPAATASLTAANQVTGIKLTWKKVTGANGYKVYRGSTLIKTITSGNTVTFADTKANTNGTKYTYKVVAKASTGDSTLSRSRVIYHVSRPAISSVTNSASKKMTVKWGKHAKANGYQIQYSTDKNFKSDNKAVTVASASTVSRVIGSLTKGKTYYVRIRTYKTVGSAKYWSVWSAAKSVKIAK